MDAIHFRLQAAHAREMAMSGEDLRLTEMLLEVARELDAEADALEAVAAQTPATPRAAERARLHAVSSNRNTMPAGIFDLAIFGVSKRDSLTARRSMSKTTVQDHALQLQDTDGER